MKEETKKWIEQAERDLKTAENDLESKDYYAASFWCQQAAEKALKAVILEKRGELIKIHDLVELGKKAGIEEKFLNLLERLTYIYTNTRYPDTGTDIYTKEESKKDIKAAKEIISWTKKNI